VRHPAALVLIMVTALPGLSSAQEFDFDAFGDARVVKAPDSRSWRDGGLGKQRYGDGNVSPELGEISAIGTAQLSPEISAYAHARYEPTQRSAVDLVEAYARYRPVSTTPLRWSVKAGAFFPPVSLENEGIGWTSLWTLTPSAINSWVGEELRTLGGEAQLEWRGVEHQLEATAALFGVNDPAGVLLADRGWAFGDHPTGLFDHNRLPDAIVRPGQAAPVFSQPFQEIDGRVGWYSGLSWRWLDYGRIAVLYYNNEADPSASSGQFAWRTEFWSLGAETRIDDVVVKAQLMLGNTVIAPRGRSNRTDFEAAYLLVGWDLGPWRVAGRVDQFGTNGSASSGADMGESGYAGTAALTWRPRGWLRITGELLHIDSDRQQRTLVGLPAHARDTQLQLAFRLFY
jgi:hypothetical protein